MWRSAFFSSHHSFAQHLPQLLRFTPLPGRWSSGSQAPPDVLPALCTFIPLGSRPPFVCFTVILISFHHLEGGDEPTLPWTSASGSGLCFRSFFRWKRRDFGSGGTNLPGRSLPRPRFSPCSAPMNRNSHEKPNGKISCSSCRFSSKPQSFAKSERPDQFWIFLSLTGCKQAPPPPLARS